MTSQHSTDPAERDSHLERLAAAASKGDRAAWDALARETYDDAYHLALHLTGSEEDARDVAQDAFVRAHKGLKHFRGDAQFTTWLYRITANCASSANTRRRRRRTDPLGEDVPLIEARQHANPELGISSYSDRVLIKQALATLPVKLRQVIVLRDIYELPHKEIAARLGVSEAAAKVRLHRARRKLKAALESSR